MLVHSIIKYLILDQCIETMFNKIYINFQTPDDRMIKIIRQIYHIYSNAKLSEGINIGTFEQFYEEQMNMLKYSGDNTYSLLCIQLDFMKKKYPEYIS